jgi:hypothetical protein
MAIWTTGGQKVGQIAKMKKVWAIGIITPSFTQAEIF